MSDLARQVRERLGLPPDATDEQVTAALDARLGTQGDQATGQAPQTQQTGQAQGDGGQAAGPTSVPAQGGQQNAQPAGAEQTGQPQSGGQQPQGQQAPQDQTGQPQQGAQNGQQGQGGGQVSASAIERLIAERVQAATAPLAASLAETSRELADRKERERRERRDQLLASAVARGRITPASLEDHDGRLGWRSQYDASPAGAAAVEQVMASLADGAAVPTSPLGTPATGQEPDGSGFTDADYYRLFPDEKRQGAAQ